MSDRRGPLLPTRIVARRRGRLLARPRDRRAPARATSPLIVVAALSYGVLFTPAFALLADGAEEVGLPQGMAFGLMNVAWAVGAVVGPAAGGAIAAATGDWIPFVLAAALCAAALGALLRRRPNGARRGEGRRLVVSARAEGRTCRAAAASPARAA